MAILIFLLIALHRLIVCRLSHWSCEQQILSLNLKTFVKSYGNNFLKVIKELYNVSFFLHGYIYHMVRHL